jgi:hypothetical protein
MRRDVIRGGLAFLESFRARDKRNSAGYAHLQGVRQGRLTGVQSSPKWPAPWYCPMRTAAHPCAANVSRFLCDNQSERDVRRSLSA